MNTNSRGAAVLEMQQYAGMIWNNMYPENFKITDVVIIKPLTFNNMRSVIVTRLEVSC